MEKEGLERLLGDDKYQVFLFSSPAMIPLHFAVHLWFVVVWEGKVSRWEVLHRKGLVKTSWGYLHLNAFNPTAGFRKIIFLNKRWESALLYSTKGQDGSIAHRLASFLNEHSKEYPYKDRYFALGPNSNTFVKWVLHKFPEVKLSLPNNAIGKNYKIDQAK